MLNYKHILVATDLSKNNVRVIEQAKEIAQKCNAKLSVIHVLEHSPVSYGGEFSIPIEANLEQTLEANARESLAKLAFDFKISEDDIYLERGSVKYAVKELSNKLKIDLVIVGTHGHHGLDILLGSRANAILHVSDCDVLVVKIQE